MHRSKASVMAGRSLGTRTLGSTDHHSLGNRSLSIPDQRDVGARRQVKRQRLAQPTMGRHRASAMHGLAGQIEHFNRDLRGHQALCDNIQQANTRYREDLNASFRPSYVQEPGGVPIELEGDDAAIAGIHSDRIKSVTLQEDEGRIVSDRGPVQRP